MVNGLQLFRDRFAAFRDFYTLIGGAACELWMNDRGLEFRAKVDLDLVVVFDDEREAFCTQLWAFVKEGLYEGYEKGESPSNF